MRKILLLAFPVLFSANAAAQDTCAGALPISLGTHVVSGINGSQIPVPICAANGPGNTSAGEWYSFTPAEDLTVLLTTDLPINNSTDTRFHVYTGGCNALVCHSGDDDSGAGYTSMATFEVAAGTTYYIAFDNRWTSAGFTFQISEYDGPEPIDAPITFTGQTFGVAGGTKSCVVDMNGDYLDDIVSVNTSSVHILYQAANGSGFTGATITTPAADFTPSWSIAAGDIDKNGRNDLLYGSGSGVTFMKQNDAGTGFTEMSGPQYVFSQRSNFVDINGDGHLDAFVCHDVAPNVYYINDGTGNLAFNQGGLGDFPSGGNYGSIWMDYDNDGDQDLFIAKCRGGNSGANVDELHRNDGNGDFTNVSIESNMAEPSQSWSSAWGDFDNDGDMDAVIGASSFTNGGHKFRMNNGDGTFSDITASSGWDTFVTTNIEHVAHDFDNDGFVDVFAGGSTIMFNNGDMTFSPVPVSPSNGPIGDLNNDGFLDVQNGTMVYFNSGNDNNWIKVHLQGVESNSNGIGARVEIHGDFGMKIRDVRSGDGFRYMSSLNTHFGIGASESIDEIIVRWPSGTVDVIENPEINASLLVIEGSAPLSNNSQNISMFGIYPNPVKETLHISVASTEIALSSATIFDLTGRKVMASEGDFNEIKVSSLARGSYVLLLTDIQGRQQSLKFIKE